MLYKRIRDLREDHDLTQAGAGAMLGLPQRTYAYYESGERMIPPPVLAALADLYGVSVDFLLERTDNPVPPPSHSHSNRKNLKRGRLRIERQSLAEQVYRYLKKAILLQTIPALEMGQTLLEAELAKMLGCSTTPVREAINMLRRDRLIVSGYYRSSKVVSYSVREIRDMFYVRLCLESAALRLAISRITHEDILVLRKNIKAFQTAHETHDFLKIFARNNEFHGLFLERSENALLRGTLKQFTEQLQMIRVPMLRARWTQIEASPALSVMEHIRLLDSIEMNRLEEAMAVLEEHITRVSDSVCDYYRQKEHETENL